MTLASHPLFVKAATDCICGLSLGVLAFALIPRESKAKSGRLEQFALGGIVLFGLADMAYTASACRWEANAEWYPFGDSAPDDYYDVVSGRPD